MSQAESAVQEKSTELDTQKQALIERGNRAIDELYGPTLACADCGVTWPLSHQQGQWWCNRHLRYQPRFW